MSSSYKELCRACGGHLTPCAVCGSCGQHISWNCDSCQKMEESIHVHR